MPSITPERYTVELAGPALTAGAVVGLGCGRIGGAGAGKGGGGAGSGTRVSGDKSTGGGTPATGAGVSPDVGRAARTGTAELPRPSQASSEDRAGPFGDGAERTGRGAGSSRPTAATGGTGNG